MAIRLYLHAHHILRAIRKTRLIIYSHLKTTDDPADGTSWYLINCIAGVEFDLLNQCREVTKHFSTKDVEKFVVPTERHLRSHGDKKKVVDVKVRYPGYVFCKIRLCEDVYETLQELEYARSWMGTVNRKGHKKLPPAPMPLGPEEVVKFKGLEEEQEVFEDMFGGDYTGRADHGADLLTQYAGYDVGQMVKILKGRFEGEDGTVRRLKNGQLMVRMFTYGQIYDEWFDPDVIRPLTDLEVMRGFSGPTAPINQDQFDVSIGKADPSILKGSLANGDTNVLGSGGSASMRSSLLQSAGAGPSGRNRREDRIARGETGIKRDIYGRNPEDMKREEQNWLAYREEQRAGGSSNVSSTTTSAQLKPVKKKNDGPKKGQDTWCVRK
jgi:transcription antitermination factor NusG